MQLTKKQQKIYNWLLKRPGYLKKGINFIIDSIPGDINYNDMKVALKQAKIDSRPSKSKIGNEVYTFSNEPKNFKDTVWGKKMLNFSQKPIFNKYNPDNVLFIADLHAPWILDGYVDWCKEQQEKYNCGTVIFSGDIIDSGAWSYHEHDPDGLGVKDELYAAKKQLKTVYEAFPQAIVLLGNHDLLISRKAKTAGLSQEFIKGLGDILEAPKDWKFVHQYIKDNVQYIHGSVGDAFKRAVDSRISTCQGHIHSKSFVQWSVSEKDAIFGLQVGGGFDRDKYAFDYAKPFAKKPIIGCGIILDHGTTPFVKLMPL